MKLTQNQIIAYTELPRVMWSSAYELGLSRSTLDALVRKGLAESKGAGSPGSVFSPRTTILYRAIPERNLPFEIER